MKISTIDKIRSKKNCFNVVFDDGNNIVLSADSIVKFSLNENSEISAETYRKIIDYDNCVKAIDYSLSLISKKSRSAEELKSKLAAQNYDIKTIQYAVDKMKELGYINDMEYGKNLSDLLLEKEKSLTFILTELEKRGISKEIINKIAVNIKEKKDPKEQIAALINKKFKNADFKDEKIKIKIASYLERKGFDLDDIEISINSLV